MKFVLINGRMWTGIPLAFYEYLPGDDVDALRKLPRDMTVAAFLGMLTGILAALATQLTDRKIGYSVSTLIISVCARVAVYFTHPSVNINIESGIMDYLRSYWVTAVAAGAGSAVIVVVGVMLKSFGSRDDDES